MQDRGFCILVVVLALGALARAEPLSPEDARKRLHVAPGFRIEIAAAEPVVIDPVDMAFDAHGQLWVVEMRDYPNGPTKGEPHTSRICRLIDDKKAKADVVVGVAVWPKPATKKKWPPK